jgi:large subunit ribosomal protein L18
VFRSHQHIYGQIIDDQKGRTLVSASDQELKGKLTGTKSDRAGAVGELLAKKAKKKKIREVMFDRGQYQYHGRIKALAEAARKGGLKF